MQHGNGLNGVEIATARVPAPLSRKSAQRLRSSRHRRLGPRGLVLEVLDFTPSTEHDLEASVRFPDIVEPGGQRYVFGKAPAKTATDCIVTGNCLYIGAVLGQGN